MKMNCKFTNVLVFAVGAAIGSAVTWKVLKTKYERIIQEEIESVKETFGSILPDAKEQDDSESDDEEPGRQINWDELEDLDDEDEECDSDDLMSEYARLIDNYTSEKGGARTVAKRPYVISPYDFGELDDYNRISLTYYADGTLQDDYGDIVTDVDELIGADSLNTFGEYEDDSVFVRNERLRTDFEILKDYRTYEEANTIGPSRVRNE